VTRIRYRLAVLGLSAGALLAAGSPVAGKSDSLSAAGDRLRTLGSKPYQEAVTAFLTRAEPKIVGGSIAPDHGFPWQVSLGVSWIGDPRDAHFCGGSVYSDRWIVTAAHCVVDTTPEQIAVTAGTNRLASGSVRHNVNRIIVHQHYDAGTSDNDVAMLELFDALTLDETTRAIALLEAADEAATLTENRALTVSGWGATFEGGRAVEALRFAEVPFVPRDTCNRPLVYNGQITENMICAGDLGGGIDSCQGDSGGPLAVIGQTPRLAGIVSWGIGCARPNKVGVYTRVARFASWVSGCSQQPDTCQ